MKLVVEGRRWIAHTRYEERELPKSAGFRWDPTARVWWTERPENAAKLRQYADPAALAAIDEALAAREAAIAASRAASADVDVPAPEGCAYLPFQKAGIAYALSRPACLIADEMGLGKTIQAIGLINADATIRSVLVVCPAAVKLNWARELTRWLVRPLSVGVVQAGRPAPEADVLVVNWDILDRVPERDWDLVILDEAHYAKNPKAKRTKLALGIKARRKLALTGTPILNRPIELWPLLHAWWPDEWRSWRHYVTRYCAGFEGRHGWVVDGASNLGELQERLRATGMIRRCKADVLTDLPPKRRQILEIEANGIAGVVAREQEAYSRHEAILADLRAQADLAFAAEDEEAYREAVARLRDAARVAFDEMSAVRHELALAKVPAVLDHVRNIVESEPVVVFAHHRDVAEAIAAGLPRSVLVTGETPVAARQAAVDAFQRGDADAFVATIGAAGVGLTLTRASVVVFAELDWVPARITQAEDRCHRIGQTEPVLVQHLVVDGSLDARLAKTIVEKQEIIDRALDIAPEPAEDVVLPTPSIAVPPAPPMPDPEVVEAARAALRLIAALDPDRAATRNEAGFNRYDSTIGHALAEAPTWTARQAHLAVKLALRYRRQLPATIASRLLAQGA